ncbi:hypothetical protein NQ315_015580 [Exocentrus adspersus]|uniref:Uncharacterized protein n=1 Tax=Exocentrus adspersus TaxID=1586481 RepID=A0AAV8V9E8_9CUCU|nr:hypothetical protein NQ315_015580 [Exocentrus adspersus]
MPQKGKQNKQPEEASAKLKQSNAPSLTPEFEQQFESELCWCIQQLQIALKSGKLNNKQGAITMRVKPTLPNKKSVFIKKSNILFASGNSFESSDGRDEELGNSLQDIKIDSGNKASSCDVKKVLKFQPSDNNFRFNFEVSEEL